MPSDREPDPIDRIVGALVWPMQALTVMLVNTLGHEEFLLVRKNRLEFAIHYSGTISERDLGQMEAYLWTIPLVYLLLPLFWSAVVIFTADGLTGTFQTATATVILCTVLFFAHARGTKGLRIRPEVDA